MASESPQKDDLDRLLSCTAKFLRTSHGYFSEAARKTEQRINKIVLARPNVKKLVADKLAEKEKSNAEEIKRMKEQISELNSKLAAKERAEEESRKSAAKAECDNMKREIESLNLQLKVLLELIPRLVSVPTE